MLLDACQPNFAFFFEGKIMIVLIDTFLTLVGRAVDDST